MASDVVSLQAVQRTASPAPDGVQLQPRAGSLWRDRATTSLVPTKHLLADEASYYVATNQTIGTGVTFPGLAAFQDNAPWFALYNNDFGARRRFYLDYVTLLISAAGSSITSLQCAIRVDPKARANTNANVSTITPVCTLQDNLGFSGAPSGVLLAGSNSANQVILGSIGSSASVRTVGRGMLRAGNPAAGDVYTMQFGGRALASSATAATAGRTCLNFAPASCGPGGQILVYLWAPGAVGSPSLEFELGFWCR